MLFINKLFNSIACLLSFINLQLVIPGRTWILLYLGRTMYNRLWACLVLYLSIYSWGRGSQFTYHLRTLLAKTPAPTHPRSHIKTWDPCCPHLFKQVVMRSAGVALDTNYHVRYESLILLCRSTPTNILAFV